MEDADESVGHAAEGVMMADAASAHCVVVMAGAWRGCQGGERLLE
jgi:hypothetical protein